MKKALVAVLASALLLSGCASEKKICGQVYTPYGIFNTDENLNPAIRYEVPVLNVVAAVVFIETVIVPVYIIGWDLYEPVGPRVGKGVVSGKCPGTTAT